MLSYEQCFILFLFFLFFLQFCVFVAGWRHALQSEWPFMIIYYYEFIIIGPDSHCHCHCCNT